MSHKFNPAFARHLDNPFRKLTENPWVVFKRIGLKAGQTFADIGAGPGFFSFPASQVVGKNGKVLAIDIEPGMIDILRKKVSMSGQTNIEIIHSSENDPGIPASSADIVFMSNILHEACDREAMVNSVYKALKKNGTIAIIEFRSNPLIFGPPVKERVSQDEVRMILGNAGFRDTTALNLGLAFYLITSIKP